MHRFYAPLIASTLALPEEESRHAARVLRLAEGEAIEVIDGYGTLYSCRITLSHPKHTQVHIEERRHITPHWGRQIVVAVAPPKHMERMEWVVEKCTEMGVDHIIPLLCDHSERKQLKTERLAKIMVAAMKQSLKTTLPRLDELTPLREVIDMPFDGQRLVAYCDQSLPRDKRLSLPQVIKATGNVMVLIGPEGDFSPHEVDALLAAGFTPVTLGQSRLRTETAAIMACAAAHVVHQQGNNQQS